MRRSILFCAVAAIFVLAAPAAAHEEINPSVITVNRPTFFVLAAANEEKVDLVKVTIKAPAGAPFGATTKSPGGWTAVAAENLVTWSGGTVKPDQFEQFGFETDGADRSGALAYSVTLGYADGTSRDVEVDVRSEAASAPARSGTSLSGVGRWAGLGVLLGALALALSVVALLRSHRPRRDGAGQDW